ncbi:translation initiation factor IF-3 [Candidatus Neomarinimicrobiota bacterium]
MAKDNKTPRFNEEISAPELRTISADGEQLGVISLEEALEKAEVAGLDLVEIAPQSKPPVAKIMDFGKYRYDMQKRIKENKKKQHVIAVKEVRMRPAIGEHDLETKLNTAKKFLKDGSRLKISLRFRGREMSRQDLGTKLLMQVIELLADYGDVEKSPILEGRVMTMYFMPK